MKRCDRHTDEYERAKRLLRVYAVRPETAADTIAIRAVNEQAFGGSNEADLIETLRRDATPFISLVAYDEATVVGHISFSPVTLETDASFHAMGLGPMAVVPGRQKRGIGSQLVRAGLEECGRQGCEVVVVVGHPTYYPRFGFVPGSRHSLRSEYAVPDDVFMVLELRPGALRGRSGLVRYHAAFAGV